MRVEFAFCSTTRMTATVTGREVSQTEKERQWALALGRASRLSEAEVDAGIRWRALEAAANRRFDERSSEMADAAVGEMRDREALAR